jgi:hypothetical protein
MARITATNSSVLALALATLPALIGSSTIRSTGDIGHIFVSALFQSAIY